MLAKRDMRSPTLYVVCQAAISAGCLFAPGCAAENQGSYESQLADTGRPALHAVHEERLREIMADLSRLTFEHMPQEMNVDAQQKRDAVRLATVADLLARDAKAIPLVLEDVRMASEDRRLFNSYADKLHIEAKEIASLARERSFDEVKVKLDEMVTTCNACHSAFRVIPRVRS